MLTKMAAKNRLIIAREEILMKQARRHQKLHRFLVEKEMIDRNMEMLTLHQCDPQQLME